MEILEHLDKLRVFVVVAEKKKINAAADLLNLTQPSVTRTIQKLEEVLRKKLFIRGRGGVKLTAAGEIFYRSALRVLKEIEDASLKMHESAEVMSGQITIATYESLAEYLWPDFLVKMSKLHPHLNLCIRTYSPSAHGNDLASGAIDILVDAEPRSFGEVSSFPLYTDHFGFYTDRNAKIIELNVARAANMALLYVASAFDEKNVTIEHHLMQRGYRFSRKYSFDSFGTVKRLAIRGLGLAVLPHRLAEADVRAKRLRAVQLEGFPQGSFGTHRIYASFADGKREDPRIRTLFRLLKEHLK